MQIALGQSPTLASRKEIVIVQGMMQNRGELEEQYLTLEEINDKFRVKRITAGL